MLRLHNVLLCGHHVSTALTVQHLLELRIVLAASESIVLSKVNPPTVRVVALARCIGGAHGTIGRLAIIILSHSCPSINLLKCNQIGLRELHLTVLVCFIRVAPLLATTLILRNGIDLSTAALYVTRGHHAQLAYVRWRHVEVHIA